MTARFLLPLFLLLGSLCAGLASGVSGKVEPLPASRQPALYHDLEAELGRVLGFWTQPALRHPGPGGFRVHLDAQLRPTGHAPQNLIVHLRMLYQYALALALVPERKAELEPEYERQLDFLFTRFWDAEKGGWFWALDEKGAPADRSKKSVGEVYAIYILAELHRLKADPRTLDYAIRTYDLLEPAWDTPYGGYFDAREEPWDSRANLRKQNGTNLHMVLALSRLYPLRPEARLRERLEALYVILRDRFVHPNGNGYYALTRDLKPITQPLEWEDGGLNVITCYGHNLEMLWYLLDGAVALGKDPRELKPYWEQLLKGFDAYGLRDGVAVNYIGPIDGPTEDTRILWWSQNEAMIAFLRLYELTGDAGHLATFERISRWSLDRMAADGSGCWISIIDLSGKPVENPYRGGDNWKVDFHVTRALEEIAKTSQRLAKKAL